jgi:hypothetical protein
MNFIPSLVTNCIIEEQEDHLVIAVRVPRSVIKKNVSLLAALADIVGQPDGGVWSTRDDPPDLEGDIWSLVGLTQISQRETACAIACFDDAGAMEDATNCLALSVENVSDKVNDLELSGCYPGPTLVAASRLMRQQLGIVLNRPKDMEALKSLQKAVDVAAKLAGDLDKEHGETYGAKQRRKEIETAAA